MSFEQIMSMIVLMLLPFSLLLPIWVGYVIRWAWRKYKTWRAHKNYLEIMEDWHE
jgi:uncharacterized oligopeptide transporter (OPT) family protein